MEKDAIKSKINQLIEERKQVDEKFNTMKDEWEKIYNEYNDKQRELLSEAKMIEGKIEAYRDML